MQMRMTYLPAEHKDLSPGSSVASDAFDPNAGVITTELNSNLYNEHLNEMAEQGYQLLSVQPVHRVEYTHIQNVSVIGGFYFFWQKSSALAFPMSPEFLGFPATKTANHTQQKVETPVQKIATKDSSVTIGAAAPIQANEPQKATIDKTDSESTGHRASNKPIEHNEQTQTREQDANVDSRVSTIKKLLQEKSSKKGNKLNPQSIEIPPEANTQLLKNIEDLHNLGRTATSRKDKNPGIPRNPDTDSKPNQRSKTKPESKPDIDSDSDEHLDLDLDFDF